MDEFHLHVCAEAWRVFGVEMFPKVCDSYLRACVARVDQPYPTCELCAAGMAQVSRTRTRSQTLIRPRTRTRPRPRPRTLTLALTLPPPFPYPYPYHSLPSPLP